MVLLLKGTFQLNELCQVSATGFAANLNAVTDITNNGLFEFNETVSNLTGDIARVEQINLGNGSRNSYCNLRYTIGAATTTIETINANQSNRYTCSCRNICIRSKLSVWF